MNLILEYGQISLLLNLVLRVLTAYIFCAFLIPLFIKEARVKNGLQKLRIEMLTSGSLIFLINTLGIFIIAFRYLGYDTRILTEVITYFNSLAFLAYALIKLNVYTEKYTPENKKLHEKFDKMESDMRKEKQNK